MTNLEAVLTRRSVWVEEECVDCEGSGELPGFISEDGAMILCLHCDGGGTVYVTVEYDPTQRGGPRSVEHEYNVIARVEMPALPPR